MKVPLLFSLIALTVTTGALSAQAQAPAAPAPAAPAEPAPAQPAPAPAQPAPAQPAPAAQPPRPFPQGSKYAYIDIQLIANASAEGKASTAKVKALNDKKVAELAEKTKALQANQQKLAQGGTVLSDTARAQLEKEVERQGVEIERFKQDATADVTELQQSLQIEFQRKLAPIIQQLADDMSLHMIFSQADAGIVWADTGLDITEEVIKRFDRTAAAAPAPKPPAPAAKPPGQ
jgi:Skp family chaperone for outer membrane proteins